MKTNNVSTLVKNVQTTLVKHSPEILTGIGIAGMASAVILGISVTPKAVRLMDAKKKELHKDKLTVAETIKTTWKCYLPVVATGGLAAACLIGANSVNTKRKAALAAAYNLSTAAFSEYREKVVETIGEKKERAIKEEIAEDRIKKNPASNQSIIMTNRGNTLFDDLMFGRYFYSDLDAVRRAMIEINRAIVLEGYASLNDFYSELGLEPVGIGDEIGWKLDDGEIRIEESAHLADDGRPCIGISYNVPPKYDFSRFL